MSLIKLNKKDLKNETIFVSPSYISNGHWALALKHVENSTLLRNAESIEAFAEVAYVNEVGNDRIDKSFPKKKNLKVRSAGKILNSSHDLDPRHDRVVFADSKGETYFRRAYVKMLGIADVELYGDTYEGAFTNEEGTIVLMPMRR